MNNIFAHIKRALTRSKRPVFLEIGAAWGEDTARIIRLIEGRDGAQAPFEYYAFEPDPRNVATIKGKAEVIGKVHLIEAAVGDKNKRTAFHQSSGTNSAQGCEHTLSGSVKKPVEHLTAFPWVKFKSRVEVRMMRLDDFCACYSLSHIDFIWCDVQGAEDLVLAGAQQALAHTRFFYTEFYDNQMYEGQINAKEIFLRLPGKWRVVDRWPSDILFENLRPIRRRSNHTW